MKKNVIRKILAPLFFLKFMTFCSNPYLSIQKDYISYLDLASYRVGTPDPRKECSSYGERLILVWRLSQESFKDSDCQINLYIRYGCREDELITFPLTSNDGWVSHLLLNEEYESKEGFLTYKADLVCNGEIVKTWTHQMWKERILF